ncbi:uncharacterized protein LOC126995934 [Eriocheir sinensis]|uniref:uncharacterized protein LOC126995934 n=1 Tax=Eriocheir sinensis TaxID=95602 RepID=UPI0021C7968A|nr:uncharacterized protein LOC126995934 [Eriocheir sinensis]
MKHALLIGVRNGELRRELITMDASRTLQETVTKCRSYEATDVTYSEIETPSTAVRGVSQYKKGKKAAHAEKAGAKTSTPPSSTACISCGTQHGSKPCPAAAAPFHGCGREGHRMYTVRCSAKGVQCGVCLRVGHYDRFCSLNKPKKPKPRKGPSLGVVRTPPPDTAPRHSEERAGHVWRVDSNTRPRAQPSPTIRVAVTQGDTSGRIDVISDTGADVTVIGLQHLKSLGLHQRDLQPPPSINYYNADDSQMQAAVGSFQVELTYGDRSCEGWIDVQSSLTTPLLSWEHCKALGVVPADFPRPRRGRRPGKEGAGQQRTARRPRSGLLTSPEPAHTATTRPPYPHVPVGS